MSGRPELKRRLAAIQASVNAAVKPAVVAAAEELATEMQAVAPANTGALRDSIHVTIGPGSTGPGEVKHGSMSVPDGAAVVTAGDERTRQYVADVEYGTSRMAPEPFFWPTYRAQAAKLQKSISDALKAAVSRGWKS